MTLTQIKSAGLSTPVDLADNARIRLGTGNDLQIYHNSTSNNSHIDESGSGSLVIKATNTYINSSADEAMVAAIADGSVELYYDNSKQFETLSTGTRTSGNIQLPFVDANNGLRNKISWVSQANFFDEVAYITVDRTATSGAVSDMVFATGSANAVSEAMRIKADGKVGIGDSTPNYELQVNDPSGTVSVLQLTNTTTGTGVGDGFLVYNNGLNAILSNEEAGDLRLQTSGVQRLTIDSSNGDVHVNTGNLKIATSGNGIDFSAVSDGSRTIYSNLFDDYEEGHWTPVLRGSGSAGTVTYSAQKGNYVKVGRKVTVSFYVVWSFFNGTGDIEVGGLPFTTWNNNNVQHAGPVMTTNLGYPSNVTYIVTHNWYGVDYFKLYGQYSGGGWDAVQVDGAAGIIGTLTYFANS